MVRAIVLSGGTGTRLGGSIPKQYIDVAGKPVLIYCLEKLQACAAIDSVIIVADPAWQDRIREWLARWEITKFEGFAAAGSSRQHSISNGLEFARCSGVRDDDIVVIHDAARPNVTDRLLTDCVSLLTDADGVMPALPVKDTMYLSEDGRTVASLLDRDKLFAGQAPESFLFGKYYSLHVGMTEAELAAVRGSSEIAFRAGLRVAITAGDEHNYKITTISDLERFTSEVSGN